MPLTTQAPAAVTLRRLRDNITLVYRGAERTVDLLLAALLARGHVLIEDVPGVGKTTLARALGKSLALEFRRIQFTSDTLPADVLGISVFHAPADRFEFHPGPIFANIVLADEINRATPKTQSALLEAMNEGAVTVETERRDAAPALHGRGDAEPGRVPRHLSAAGVADGPLLPAPDRSATRRRRRRRCCCGAAARNGARRDPRRARPEQVLALQDETEKVAVSEALLDYLHALVRATRKTAELRLPVSTRGAQALLSRHAGLRARRRPRLRDARRRPGRGRGGARAPDPLRRLRTDSGRAAGAGDREEDPGPGGGAPVGRPVTKPRPRVGNPDHQLRPRLHPDVPRRRDRGDEHGQQRALPRAGGDARGDDRFGRPVAPQRPGRGLRDRDDRRGHGDAAGLAQDPARESPEDVDGAGALLPARVAARAALGRPA